MEENTVGEGRLLFGILEGGVVGCEDCGRRKILGQRRLCLSVMSNTLCASGMLCTQESAGGRG